MRPWVPLPARPWLHVTSALGNSLGRELQSGSCPSHIVGRSSRAIVQRPSVVRLATPRRLATVGCLVRPAGAGFGQASGVAALL